MRKNFAINLHSFYLTGYYQCIAKNEAGEALSTAMMKWDNRNHANALQNVKCYPINRSTLLIEFKSAYHVNTTPLFNYEIKILTKPINLLQPNNILCYTADDNTPLQSHSVQEEARRYGDHFLLTLKHRKLFTPFTLYVRALEKAYSLGTKNVYEMSRMSEGVKCALQGCKLIFFKIISNHTNVFVFCFQWKYRNWFILQAFSFGGQTLMI